MLPSIEQLTPVFEEIYGNETHILAKQKKRFQDLIEKFQKQFSAEYLHFFSTPGRTEIGGNHTDHNHGRVLAASVNLDAIAAVSRTDSGSVVLYSEGYSEPFVVDLNHLNVVEAEKGSTTALIRGIAARFKELGYRIGGFNAYVSSQVLPGSGLSSSASIEVLIGTIFNHIFNEGSIDLETLAIIGQYAENVFFGKPCGLMDQIACAFGGIVTIDFKNPRKPEVQKIDFDFQAQDYSLLVVDTGGNHADLTYEYAAVPAEMKAVAEVLGAKVCREISWDVLFKNLRDLRQKTGDRAILRAMHFIGDNTRVVQQVNALEEGNFQQFLALVNESSNSSFKWLQNIYSTQNVREQGLTLALALSEKYIREIGEGACRVHGGGFAGTIQAFLPNKAVSQYIEMMESVFGSGSVLNLKIRPHGTVCLNTLL